MPKSMICLRRLLFNRPDGRERIDVFYHFPPPRCHGIVKILDKREDKRGRSYFFEKKIGPSPF